MISLANITQQIRTLGKFAVILIVIGIFLFLGFQGVQVIARIVNPPEPPPAEMSFGLLKDVTFPSQNPPTKQYSIDTKTGTLPRVPDRIRVYKTSAPSLSFSALVDARKRVRGQGFSYVGDGVQVASKSNVYAWQDAQGNTLNYNIATYNFEIIPNPASTHLQSIPGSLPPANPLTSNARNLTQRLGNSTEMLDTPVELYTYYQNSGTALSPVDNPNNATAARVYFLYKPLEVTPFTFLDTEISSLPVVNPVPSPDVHSNMYITYIATALDVAVMQAKFNYQNINREEFSDYYIKTSDQAFEDLKAGKAYVVSGDSQPSVAITDVSLAYYIGDDLQEFIYPVFVFKGKNFVAYVSALSERSILN